MSAAPYEMVKPVFERNPTYSVETRAVKTHTSIARFSAKEVASVMCQILGYTVDERGYPVRRPGEDIQVQLNSDGVTITSTHTEITEGQTP